VARAGKNGPDLDASTALTELARAFLEQPITEAESAARKAFQVVYHRCTDCERAWMMSSDGPQGVDAATIDARARRAEVIRLDESPRQSPRREISAPRGAERSTVQFLSTPGSPAVPGAERDRSNTALIRQHVLSRDGRSCAVPGCANKGHLASHHIIWREQGGATTVENEVSVCRTCHSLIHEGFLFVTGRTPTGLRWLGPDQKPFETFVSPAAPAVPDYVREIKITAHEAAPRGAGLRGAGLRSTDSGDASPFGDTTIQSLDEVADEVSAEWWQAHRHNFTFKGDRVFLKRSL